MFLVGVHVYNLTRKMTKFIGLSLLLIPAAYGVSTVVSRIGKFDYVSGSNGYSGTGTQIGNFYHYNDNLGNNYTTTSIGSFDYTSGSNGYSSTGTQIGNFYFLND
jgi:hypothetical protein